MHNLVQKIDKSAVCNLYETHYFADCQLPTVYPVGFAVYPTGADLFINSNKIIVNMPAP